MQLNPDPHYNLCNSTVTQTIIFATQLTTICLLLKRNFSRDNPCTLYTLPSTWNTFNEMKHQSNMITFQTYVKDYFFRKITEISRKTQSEIIKCAQKILSNAQNFDVIFPGLDNLKRIHFNSIIEIQETK